MVLGNYQSKPLYYQNTSKVLSFDAQTNSDTQPDPQPTRTEMNICTIKAQLHDLWMFWLMLARSCDDIMAFVDPASDAYRKEEKKKTG